MQTMKPFRIYTYTLSIVVALIIFTSAVIYYFGYQGVMQEITSSQRALIVKTTRNINTELRINTQIARTLATFSSNIALAQIDPKKIRKPIQQTREYSKSKALATDFFVHFPSLAALEIQNIQGTPLAHFTNTHHNHAHFLEPSTPATEGQLFDSATCEADNTTITYFSILLYKEGTKEVVGLLRLFINLEEREFNRAQRKNRQTYILNSNFKPLFASAEQRKRASSINFKEVTHTPLGELVQLEGLPDYLAFAQYMPKTDWYIVNVTHKDTLLIPLHKLNRFVLSFMLIAFIAYLALILPAIYYFQNKMDAVTKKTNEELLIQERRMQLIERQNSLLNVLFETIPFAVAICTDTKVLYANTTCTVLLGLREGKNIKNIFIDPTQHEAIIALCTSKGVALNIQARVQDRCQRERHVLLTTRSIIFESCNAFIYWINDTNTLRESELQLKEKYTLLESIFDAIPQSVFHKNLQGQYLFCNLAFSHFTNTPKEFLLGKADKELIRHSPSIAHVHQGNESHVFENDTPLVMEEGILLGDDDTRFFETTKFVHKDNSKRPLGIIGVIHDITKHKILEEELIQNRRHAEISSKTKSAFLSNMSHEMRVAMNGIVGLTYLALRSELDPQQRDYLLKVENASQNVLTLINNILDISSIEAGKFELEVTPFRLQDILRSILDMIDPAIKQKHLLLEVDIDPMIPAILVGDSLRFSQILVNILQNAVHFTSIGSIALSIRMTEETADNCLLTCEITDTGIGITGNKLKQILATHKVTTNRDTVNHAGLGLPIVQGLVQLMKGTLSASSELGQGSTFTFTALLEKPAANADEEAEKIDLNIMKSAYHEPTNDRLPLEGLHILVAEDNEINQLIAKEILEQFGCVVYLVGNGIEAISLVSQTSVDAILMDIQMPLMDGLSAATTLKQSPQYAHIPIIAMTAHALESDKERSLKIGMQDHITKPIDPMLLLRTLQKVLKV